LRAQLRQLFAFCLLIIPLSVQAVAPAFVQQAYLKASNTGKSDQFGYSVAISGDTLVVGAPREASDGSSQDDDSDKGAGAVYVFVRENNQWSQQAYLKASNVAVSGFFGGSISISGDTLVVGASYESSGSTGVNGEQDIWSATNSGAAYVFVRNGETWSQQAYLKASNTDEGDLFGVSVGVSGDTIVVGAEHESSNAVGVDGDDTDNSMNQAGAAYVFNRVEGLWSQQAYLKASSPDGLDRFGQAVAIDGDTIVIGAYQEDARGIFDTDDSSRDTGAAYVFIRDGETWSQQSYLKAGRFNAAGDNFGKSVAISNETIVIGAPKTDKDSATADSGAAYVFVRDGTSWNQQARLLASNVSRLDEFGGAVSISGDSIIVGATDEDSDATGVSDKGDHNFLSPDSGAAYTYLRDGTDWIHESFIKASNTGAGDLFGAAVAVSGLTIAVGAHWEFSNATGINGDQTNNDAGSAGAAYVFKADVVFADDFE
jgi:hypothetical protein